MPSGFATMQEAALAGMDSCKRTQPRDKECGFGVYQARDGLFHHTDVQVGKDGSIENMPLRFPSSAKLVAFGHTHPADARAGADDTSNAFSAKDLEFAKRMGLEMFMGSEKTGKVVHYQTGKTKTDKHSRLGKISYGDEIGEYGFPDPAPEPTRREAVEAAYNLHQSLLPKP